MGFLLKGKSRETNSAEQTESAPYRGCSIWSAVEFIPDHNPLSLSVNLSFSLSGLFKSIFCWHTEFYCHKTPTSKNQSEKTPIKDNSPYSHTKDISLSDEELSLLGKSIHCYNDSCLNEEAVIEIFEAI